MLQDDASIYSLALKSINLLRRSPDKIAHLLL